MSETHPEHEPVAAMVARVEAMLSKAIKQIPEATAKQLAKDNQFIGQLGKFLVDTGTVNSLISRELHMSNGQGNVGDVNDVVNQIPVPQDPGIEVLPDEPTPPSTEQAPIIPPPTSPNDYRVEFLGENTVSPFAVVRYDSSHQLFPNRVVLYVLVENSDTHMTYWQIELNPEPFLAMAIEAALHDTPANVHRRCAIQRLLQSPETTS